MSESNLSSKKKTAQANGDNVLTHMYYASDIKEFIRWMSETLDRARQISTNPEVRISLASFKSDMHEKVGEDLIWVC